MVLITKTINDSYEVQEDDFYLGVNCEKPITITLPSEVENGRFLVIKAEMKPPMSNRIITIKAPDKTIDGYASRTLQVSHETVRLIYNDNWVTI